MTATAGPGDTRPGDASPTAESSDEVVPLAWPVARQVSLTLDFECDFGTALSTTAYEAVTHVDRLVALLERLDVPVTTSSRPRCLTSAPRPSRSCGRAR